ncbi:MAG: metallophosphoesterase, partial [Planctomycetota bacterium]
LRSHGDRANGDNGVLIVAGGKNEDNFALSRSSGDGRYTIDIHDNGTDGETGENDPAAFVYLPYETEGLVAGRVSETSGRRPVVLSGTGAFSVSSVASGSVLLRIDGVTDDTAGVLLLTPEGGGSRNRDNIVVSSWDAAAGGFVLESRDIPSMTLEGLAGEPMFGFAYIPITPGPGFDPRPNTSTIVALPDTQLYAQNTPAIFTRQLEWIDDAAEPLRIPFVLHLGDITNRNNDPQWAVADAAFAQIDGRVPYVLAQGNHDAGPNGNADDRSTLMNQYFPLSRVGRERSFGGTFEPGRVENSFSMFEAANRRWLVLSLEWGPRDAVLAWANQVIADHPDHLAILITHAYMYNDDTRMDRLVRQTGGSPYSYGTASQPGGTNDGGDIWRGVVSQHPSVAMVLSGHIKGEGRLSSPTTLGGVAHQMLSDYQGDLEGGQGYLRLLEVTPDSNVVRVRTYSPWVDRWFTSPGAHFEIELRGETAARALIEPLDLAAPLGEIDIFDLITFLERFDAGDAIADRSPPYGVLDQADLQTFLDGFASP